MFVGEFDLDRSPLPGDSPERNRERRNPTIRASASNFVAPFHVAPCFEGAWLLGGFPPKLPEMQAFVARFGRLSRLAWRARSVSARDPCAETERQEQPTFDHAILQKEC